jgi:hypothetical protein
MRSLVRFLTGLHSKLASDSCGYLRAHVLTLLSLDIKIRANVAVELRDNIEPLCSGASYPIFLSKLWPVFKKILQGEPVFTNLSLEQVSWTALPHEFGHGSFEQGSHVLNPLETTKLRSRDTTPASDDALRRRTIRRGHGGFVDGPRTDRE